MSSPSSASTGMSVSSIWWPERTNLDGPAEYDQLLAIAEGPYRWALLTNAIFVCGTFPLLLFLILRRSPPELSLCIKTILLLSTVTCALQSVWHAATQHVPMFPLFLGFSVGLFRHRTFMTAMFAISFQFMAPTILCLNCTFAFTHYYALINPTWRFARSFGKMNVTLCLLYIAAFATNFIIVCWFVSSMIVSPGEVANTVNALPAITFYSILAQNEESLLGVAVLDTQFWVSACCFYVWLGGMAVLIVLLNFWIVLQMHRMSKANSSKTTLRMLQVAYRYFLAQSLLLLVFFFIPFGVLKLSMLNIIHSYIPSIASFALISLYSSVVFLQTLFLVKPYRRWIFAAFPCFNATVHQMASSSKVASIHAVRQNGPRSNSNVIPIVGGSNSNSILESVKQKSQMPL